MLQNSLVRSKPCDLTWVRRYRRRDSNPQELSLRDVSDLCVYPFHVTGSGRGCTVWLSEMSKVREGRTWYSGPRRHPDFAMDLSTQKVW